MLSVRTAIFACVILAACDGNPFVAQPEVVPPVVVVPTPNASVSTLSGTTEPSQTAGITRTEVKDKGPEIDGSAPTVVGNGYAQDFTYNKADDTFIIDNLAFDGDNIYTRSTTLPRLGVARVYENASTYVDPQTGAIEQLSYRALYGVSKTKQTSFAIVRTGSYRNFGFGGFKFARENGVVLPTQGQAKFDGRYQGMRDFDGSGGLQYTRGDMTVDIDFNDFNPNSGLAGGGVLGTVKNRKILDLDGNDITASVLAGINAEKNASLTALPILQFFVGSGNLDLNGELEGQLDSVFRDDNGDLQDLEAGKYYAMISGPNADEMVGILVVTSSNNGVTARETGGFILYRP
jgi:hypothetical protein